MRINHHIFRTRFSLVTAGMMLCASLVVPGFYNQDASAAQITNRSLTLQAGSGGDGGSLAGGEVNHLFDFTVVGGSVGSVKFEYCTTAAAVPPPGIGCDTPAGLDTTSATLGNSTGATGFVNMDNATNGTVVISRASAAATSGAVSFRLDDIINPSDINTTFFVRISMHTSLDATDAVPVDDGTVAASTAERIRLSGTMPESLVFCTGETVGVNAGLVPDCSTATSGVIAFDRLFSPTDTAISNSQMAASTNAGFGYSITVNGPTLTSGSNTIAAMDDGAGAATTSIQGTPQFGLNLVENITTSDNPFGAILTSTGGSLYTGAPAVNYDTAEEFKFGDGDVVASSSGGSDAQIYTVSYIANVPGSQPAGTYSTTLTYICTPTF